MGLLIAGLKRIAMTVADEFIASLNAIEIDFPSCTSTVPSTGSVATTVGAVESIAKSAVAAQAGGFTRSDAHTRSRAVAVLANGAAHTYACWPVLWAEGEATGFQVAPPSADHSIT